MQHQFPVVYNITQTREWLEVFTRSLHINKVCLQYLCTFIYCDEHNMAGKGLERPHVLPWGEGWLEASALLTDLMRPTVNYLSPPTLL